MKFFLALFITLFLSPIQANPQFLSAIQSGDHTELKRLLQEKEDPNQKTICGDSMLMYARDLETVKILIQAGAKPNELDANGYSTLMLLGDSPEIADFLIKKNAKLEFINAFGQNALHLAVKRKNEKLATFLSKFKALDKPDKQGNTPLLYAIDQGNSNLIGEMLKNQANPNVSGSHGSALHLAIRNGDITAVQLLLKYKARKDTKDDYGFTASDEAKRSGNLELQKLLLQ